ncbi:MAG: ATP-binding protein [Chloroflexota bacterium]|nr:MAG: hypothetical protein DIU68_00485 [Chloroflexota bacterium]
MTEETLTNPYLPARDTNVATTLAGRKRALARLRQYLNDRAADEALLFLGRPHIGKTTLARHIEKLPDEHFVNTYVSLAEMDISGEEDWLLALAQAATEAVARRGFTLSRLRELQPPDGDARAWFAGAFLPELFVIIRAHRRLVYIFDDAHVLLRAVQRGDLPADVFSYLHQLLLAQRQLALVMMLDTEAEPDLLQMSPLVSLDNAHRLGNLSVEDAASFLQDPVGALYQVPEPTAAAIHRATGGMPLLLQLFGSALFWRWEDEPDINVMTTDDVRAITPQVYARADEIFEEIWQRLSQNERLTLTAISQLLYRDPLRAVDAGAIEAWLVQTDYPLDRTAIAAAVRSLEYEELVSISPSGITLTMGLLQTWLLENAALNRGVDASNAGTPQRRLQALLLALAAVIIAVIVLTALSNSSRPPVDLDLAPTVTLVTAE